MSAKPREEPGSEGRWFGEEFEKIERVGSTAPRFDEPGDGQQSKSWEDETYEEKQFYHQPEINRKRPPVAMETASTDGSDSALLRKSVGEGDLYTSLLSSQSYSLQQGFSRDSQSRAQDRIPSLESRGVFGSDSGVKTTPGEPGDFARNLLESEKMEAYNYMDISHVETPRAQQQGGVQGSWGEAGGPGRGSTWRRAPPRWWRLWAQRRTPRPSLMWRTPLTRSCPTTSPARCGPRPGPRPCQDHADGDRGPRPTAPPSGHRQGQHPQPGPAGHPHRHPIRALKTTALGPPPRPSQASGAGDVSSAQAQVSVSGRAPTQPGPPAERGVKSGAPKPPPAHDQDSSSAESGDSEIELYSILREEREAELDSELIIESFDASSASEESPKRGQGSPAQKGRRVASRPVDPPPVPPSRAAPSPPAVPAPAAPSAGAQKPATGETGPVPGRGGDEAMVVKPKPSPTTRLGSERLAGAHADGLPHQYWTGFQLQSHHVSLPSGLARASSQTASVYRTDTCFQPDHNQKRRLKYS
ncbi:hypothetical protein AAFF_G00203230 [Aldrovandia affinis]|uniref:Uncharacterized protein n=1 Tax=Aldrovandia affinis TaxID=143900 RepID=A0AAD7SX05_9TELE|nr:hypothetical protein AAFF_G00203230 [Aldrovandia affinis]